MTEQEARIRELESQLAERDEMISTLQNSIKELNRLVDAQRQVRIFK